MTPVVEVIPCLNISALEHVTTSGVLATGSTAIVANVSNPPTLTPGGQGATFLFIAGSTPYASNGVSVVNAIDGGGQWLLIESDGSPVNVLAFAADPTGTNDSTAAFVAALATKRSVFVPSGNYLLSATLVIQYPGQILYGPQPHNPSGSGLDGGATLSFSGTGLAYCIHIMPASGSQIEWAGIRDLSIDCTGVAPANNPTNVAIQVDQGFHVTLNNLYIVSPVNGIVSNGSDTTHIHRVVMDATTGGFNYKLTGSSAGLNEDAVITDCNSSGVATASLPTVSSVSGQVITLSSVAGIYPGMLLTGATIGTIPPGVQVVSVDTTKSTVTVYCAGTLPAIASGTPVRFGTIGLWMDSYATSAQITFLRNKSLMTALYIADTQNSGSEPPADLWAFDLGGDFLSGDFVVNVAGRDVYLVTPSIYGGSPPTGGGGRGIYFGPNANNMSVIGGRVAAQLYEGITLYGSGFYIQGCFVGQNGQAAMKSYDGILINSTATRVRIADNQIGYLSTTSGQQRYGINNGGAPAGEIIVEGNDLRGNGTAPVNDASLMVLGTNLGIAGSGRSVSSFSPATITATDTYVGLTNSGTTSLTVKLPSAPTFNQVVTIKDEGGTAATNAFHVTPATGTIEGASYVALTTNYGAVTVRYNGTSWFVLSNGT